MKAYPLSLRIRAARAFAAGRMQRICRPAGGMLQNVASGDLLWIREPFRMRKKFNGMAPTAADRLGARAFFAADLNAALVDAEQLGTEHPARSLPKTWHRHHAIVSEIKRAPLQEVQTVAAKAEGFTLLESWAKEWDNSQKAFGRTDLLLAKNPTVQIITFSRVALPLPDMQVPM